jgi:hypothetical protein
VAGRRILEEVTGGLPLVTRRGGVSGLNEVATLAGQLMSYAVEAIRAFGGRVLDQAQDDTAEATIGLGRRLLRKIFGTRTAGEPLPGPLADVVADPRDEDAVAALRLAIRKALAADPQLRAEVEQELARAGVTVVASGERSIAAKSITGIAVTGDHATINR